MSTQNAVDLAYEEAANKRVVIPEAVIQEARLVRLQAEEDEREHQRRINERKGRLQRSIDSFVANYPILQDSVQKLGAWSMAVIKLLAVNGLVSGIMIGSGIGETLRMIAGLTAIEANPLVATLIAIVCVSFIIFSEFARHYLEHKAGWQQPQNFKWSLRLTINAWRYKLGIGGDKWIADQTSPAQAIIVAQRVILLAVVVTALYGSMAHTIAKHEGKWYEAIVSIVTDSKLPEFSSWAIGVLITIAIAFISLTSARHVAMQTREFEETDFAIGENRIELIGIQRAADLIRARTKQIMRHEYLPPLDRTIPAVSPAATAPRHNEGAIAIRAAGLSDQTDRHQTDTRQTPDRQASGKADLVKQWFTEHPEDLEADLRTVAKKIGVGKDTVNAVRKAIRQTDLSDQTDKL